MTERIEKLVYQSERLGTTLFLDGPTEFLVVKTAEQLVEVSQWREIFGEFITPYRRMDYPIRSFPALRIYNEAYVKQFESWFIEGDVKHDIIFPANIRRNETQQIQDSLASALLQQFRRPSFFEALSVQVPGLNEYGKTFSVDKTLGFDWNEQIVPLTQITVNFRLDLREWDRYLEDSSRTKDDPFEETLGKLNRIVTVIQGLRDNNEVEVEEGLDQRITDE